MQNYPPPPGGPQSAPPGGAYPPPAPPKRSKTPWIVAGIGGCLVLIVVVVVVVVGIGFFASRKLQSTRPTDVPAATRPAATKQYVNTRAGRTGDLAENYVDFSFYYPEDWELV